jgi:hypothetical protein
MTNVPNHSPDPVEAAVLVVSAATAVRASSGSAIAGRASPGSATAVRSASGSGTAVRGDMLGCPLRRPLSCCLRAACVGATISRNGVVGAVAQYLDLRYRLMCCIRCRCCFYLRSCYCQLRRAILDALATTTSSRSCAAASSASCRRRVLEVTQCELPNVESGLRTWLAAGGLLLTSCGGREVTRGSRTCCYYRARGSR